MIASIDNPCVSIVMPIYNCDQYLREAINSILSQSFSNFEFIIINDASTDHSLEIINSYQDKRIRLFNFDQNAGIVEALNFGIQKSVGRYIMRMDGDDISHSDRIKAQVEYLEQHPHIDILGTWFMYLDSGEISKSPVTDIECLANMIKGTVVGHPTMIVRKSSIEKHNIRYRKEYQYAEDYYFLYEAITYNLKINNLPHVLFYYRRHNQQISSRLSVEQIQLTKKIQSLSFQHIFNNSKIDNNIYFNTLIDWEKDNYIDFIYLFNSTPVLLLNLNDKKLTKIISSLIYDIIFKKLQICKVRFDLLPFIILRYFIFSSTLNQLEITFESKLISNYLLLRILKIRNLILSLESKVQKFIKISNRVYKFVTVKKTFKQLIFPQQVPIVINSFNRLSYLKNLISKLEGLNYKNIIIVDNNSTYIPLLNYYKTIPYETIYLNENIGHKAFWDKGLHKRFFDSFYVYTDPDIEPHELCDKKFMRKFMNTLIRYPDINKIGFGIYTDDIPKAYKLKRQVILSEKSHLNHPINSRLYFSHIDTTFALYTPGYDLYNMGESFYTSIRTCGKYMIRHLPWYELEESEEYLYYAKTANESASWLRKTTYVS